MSSLSVKRQSTIYIVIFLCHDFNWNTWVFTVLVHFGSGTPVFLDCIGIVVLWHSRSTAATSHKLAVTLKLTHLLRAEEKFSKWTPDLQSDVPPVVITWIIQYMKLHHRVTWVLLGRKHIYESSNVAKFEYATNRIIRNGCNKGSEIVSSSKVSFLCKGKVDLIKSRSLLIVWF